MRTRDAKKEALIREQALVMIVKEGFDGFSMQKLAKIANVSPATLYIYFTNKEDLLHQLYNDVQRTFTAVSLDGFDPQINFAEGLRIQWKNRLMFIEEYPHHFQFMEQFRNSPLINHDAVDYSEFKTTMRAFVRNSINTQQIAPITPEVFWAIAFGPFYALVKFHLQHKSITDKPFQLTAEQMSSALAMVLKALQL